jgi:hypothetical protein
MRRKIPGIFNREVNTRSNFEDRLSRCIGMLGVVYPPAVIYFIYRFTTGQALGQGTISRSIEKQTYHSANFAWVRDQGTLQ